MGLGTIWWDWVRVGTAIVETRTNTTASLTFWLRTQAIDLNHHNITIIKRTATVIILLWPTFSVKVTSWRWHYCFSSLWMIVCCILYIAHCTFHAWPVHFNEFAAYVVLYCICTYCISCTYCTISIINNIKFPQSNLGRGPHRGAVAHVRHKVPIGYNGAPQIRPQKYPLPWTDRQTPLPVSSLDPSNLWCQTASGSDPPFFHNALDRQIDRPTDRSLTKARYTS